MMKLHHQTIPILATLAILPSVQAQLYGDPYYSSGSSYGERIGIGVGVALVVALVVFGVGWYMRRRRSRAFKQAYPVQPGLGYNQRPGTNPYPQHEQQAQYPMQPSYQEAPPYSNYRPDASGYTPNAYQNQAAPNSNAPSYYPPPPPVHQQNSYYAPPTTSPPTNNYNPTDMTGTNNK